MQSRSSIYNFFNTAEEAAGVISFGAGVATLVFPNPVTGGIALGAKVSQVAFGIGKVAFSNDPLNEAINVFAGIFLGKVGGAAAGKAFKAARKAGMFSLAVEQTVQFAARRLGPRTQGVIREFVKDGTGKFNNFVASTVGDTGEVSALLEQGNAFVVSAVSRGTDIASGLGNDVTASATAQVTAVRNFVGSNVDRAQAFFSSCIAFCGDDTTGGATVSLTDPLVLDLDADGLSLINQEASSVRNSTRALVVPAHPPSLKHCSGVTRRLTHSRDFVRLSPS